MKSGACATTVQPAPQGLAPVSHQIRQKPSSNLTTAKSARAGVEAAKPSANMATARAKRFIVSSLLYLPKNFPIIRARYRGKPVIGRVLQVRPGAIQGGQSMPEVVVY